jgi:hypothetical protein
MWPSAAFAGFKLPVKSFTALVEIIMMPVANSELENLKPASDLDSVVDVRRAVTVQVSSRLSPGRALQTTSNFRAKGSVGPGPGARWPPTRSCDGLGTQNEPQ